MGYIQKENIGNLGYGEELALFENPIVDGGVQKVRWIEHRPINQISDGSAIEFVISGNGNSYIDLRRTYLHVCAKIVKPDGSNILDGSAPVGDSATIDDEAKVGPVNLWLHSLFSQVDVYFQQKLVTSSNTLYFMKAYIDTILLCCPNSRTANYQAQLYYKDVAADIESVDPQDGDNRGLTIRQRYINASNTVDMQGPLMVDVCQIDRYIMNGVEVRIKLWPTPSALNIMAKSDIKFKSVIEAASLKVCHVTPTAHMLTAQQTILEKNHFALYPYIKSEIRKFTVSSGSHDFTHDDIFQNVVPTKVMICMVSNEALSGSYKKNPFNFQHFNVNFVEVSVDGESVPARAIQTKFKGTSYTSQYVTAYTSLSRSHLPGQVEHSIERFDYGNGYAIFMFDMEPEIKADKNDEDEFWPASRKGSMRIEMKFDKALSETISIIVYGTFPKTIKIDHTRAIVLT